MPTDQGHPLGVMDAPEPRSARQTINDMLDAGLLDELMGRVDAGELALTGEGGLVGARNSAHAADLLLQRRRQSGMIRPWRCR